ncbi:polysaccharide deacetylase family protein [Pseudofrankia inefficax]|uniref:polysaccharide deacetylase family protein n=1 Tax=Pseudofrankia inefficax (strain DSM 45817 / CECT 9037 / DDB 130130 / EuI1c) TaxID=298654 RepID=UPI0002E7EF5C|nr:polysaccharide deacetylase family protein [Pseudofrankia inefficax]
MSDLAPVEARERDAGRSRRRLTAWALVGAIGLASAGVAEAAGPALATEPPPAAAPAPARAGAPAPTTAPAAAHAPAAVPAQGSAGASGAARQRPAYTVHRVLPNAPANAIALTFDDGPDPTWTPQVLALLRQYDVRATFCIVGRQARAYPDLVRRIVAEGHAICNHSMTHPLPFSHRSAAAIDAEIGGAQSAITAAAGTAPRLFRAPGGDWSPPVFSAEASRGLTPVAWNVDPRDWSRPGTQKIVTSLLAAKPGDILLCHDGDGEHPAGVDRSETVQALRTVLPQLKSRGLTFVTL